MAFICVDRYGVKHVVPDWLHDRDWVNCDQKDEEDSEQE